MPYCVKNVLCDYDDRFKNFREILHEKNIRQSQSVKRALIIIKVVPTNVVLSILLRATPTFDLITIYY